MQINKFIYGYNEEDVAPNEPCHKCEKTAWEKDQLEPDTWYCFICGNIIYKNGDTFIQQCDNRKKK